jgi:hypothetical protein
VTHGRGTVAAAILRAMRPEPTSFSAFDQLLETCRRTRAALVAVLHESDEEEDVRSLLANEALAHVDAVLDGLTFLARPGSFTATELRALVRRAGIVEPPLAGSADARAANEEARRGRLALRPVDGRAMLAAGHARIVFSVIPRLPAGAVGWPERPTYADIPVPRSEGELLMRAEELARVLWRVAAGDGRRDEPLRRTLAFYETGAQLSVRGGFRAA